MNWAFFGVLAGSAALVYGAVTEVHCRPRDDAAPIRDSASDVSTTF